MKTEYKIFGIVAVFIYGMCGLYAWWSNEYNTNVGSSPNIAEPQRHIEWIGVVALALTGTLVLMCAAYFWFVSRRIDLRPEDRADGEIADGAGEIGFFSPGSYWPFGLALAAAFTGIGLVFWLVWMIALGLVSVIAATGGLLFEYYTGTQKAVRP